MCHWNRIFREATLLNRAIGEILKHVNRQGKCKISACRVVESVYFGWRWMMTLSVSRRFVTELTIDCTCRSARVLHLQQLTYNKLLATCLGYWADAWSTYMWIYITFPVYGMALPHELCFWFCPILSLWMHAGHVKVGCEYRGITRRGSNYLYKHHQAMIL